MGFLSRLPLHPFLLAAYAVLFVYAANIGEVLPRDLVMPMTVALGGAAILLLLCAIVYRDLRRAALPATAAVLAFAFFGHLTSQVDLAFVGEDMQLLACVGLVIVVGIYAWRAGGSIDRVTTGLNAFTLVLVGVCFLTIIPAESGRSARASQAELVGDAAVGEVTRKPDRDIYYIVLDRYGSEWSLEHSFGVESDLADDLAGMGFQVVPGARANYHASDFSLATTLNLRPITELVDVDAPSTDRTPVRDRLAHHDVGRFLQANGYRYVHLGAWWEPTRTSPIADQVLALGMTTELETVLREATMMPAITRVLGGETSDGHSRDQHRDQARFAFRQLQRLAHAPGRTFVFAHVLMPHPPYVLAEGGRAVHQAEAKALSEAELMQQQLDYTDDRVRAIVRSLLAGPDDEDPIIIISGDEGPYLCYEVDCVDGSAEQLGIRLGVLRAYYLPGIDYEVPPDDSGVNIFRMILREYFGADLPDLPNRSWAWPDAKADLYTLDDVTGILPLPGG